jgi:hypothetical protein
VVDLRQVSRGKNNLPTINYGWRIGNFVGQSIHEQFDRTLIASIMTVASVRREATPLIPRDADIRRVAAAPRLT